MKTVLEQIKPTRKERYKFNQTTKNFLAKLNSKLTNAQAVLGGSGAKNTWLSGSHDIDIFVLYDYKMYASKTADLSDLLERKLKQCFSNLNRLHGSRDYFQLNFEDLIIEVVPILKISKAEKAMNITDISPLHSKWVNKNTKNKKDEIRLAKQFCKANNLYGAESHITGFSGYVLEILIAHYGSFEKLLKNSSKWKSQTIIDPEKYYPKNMALFHLNKSKLNSPLVVIDPVDKSRNAAAALTLKKFNLFKKLAKQLLKKPAEKYFVKKNLELAELKKEAQKKKLSLIYLEILPLTGKNDVVGVKIMKFFEFLELQLSPFTVKKAHWDWHEMYFLLETSQLPIYEIRPGPPLELKEYVKAFKKKNKNNYLQDGKIYAKIKTKHREIKPYLDNLLKDPYVKGKVKKVKKVVIE